jgi:hypothetical protein
VLVVRQRLAAGDARADGAAVEADGQAEAEVEGHGGAFQIFEFSK